MEYNGYNEYVYNFRMLYGYEHQPLSFEEYIAETRHSQHSTVQNRGYSTVQNRGYSTVQNRQNTATQDYRYVLSQSYQHPAVQDFHNTNQTQELQMLSSQSYGTVSSSQSHQKFTTAKRKSTENISGNSKKAKAAEAAETSSSKRAHWTTVEEEVLVAAWQENYHLLDSLRRDEGWAKILSCVETVGAKTLKQIKKKIDNLKEAYKEAKLLNKETGEELHKSPYFDIFEKMIGNRHMIKLPHVKEVGAGNSIDSSTCNFNEVITSIASTSSKSNVANVSTVSTSIPVPTRSQVDEFLLRGKSKSASKPDKTNELLDYLKEDRKETQLFLEKLEAERMRNQNAERKLERDFLKELFKK